MRKHCKGIVPFHSSDIQYLKQKFIKRAKDYNHTIKEPLSVDASNLIQKTNQASIYADVTLTLNATAGEIPI